MDTDDIFNQFMEKSLFKDKSSLQFSYTPDTILHREEQINQIAKILAPSLRMEKPSNLFLYGKTGTGKTLTTRYVEQKLLEKAEKSNLKFLKIVYINCKLKKVADTEYRILAEILKELGVEVPATGLPTDQLYKKFVNYLEEDERLMILIFDEIDQAVKKIGDELLYNLTRLNSSFKKSQISFIGISNDLIFVENLDPRVKSSLGEEEIVFPPYDAIQLKDILEQRMKKAFKNGVVAKGVIDKCAAYAAHEHGDARRALELIRVAGELVEREGKDKITIEYLDKSQEKIEKDRVLGVIETQPKQFQLTLLAIMNKLRSISNGTKLFTSDIYEEYNILCRKTRLKPLTQRRIGDIIAEFDMLGIINATVISKGRYGRTREIRLAISREMIKKADSLLKESLNLKDIGINTKITDYAG